MANYLQGLDDFILQHYQTLNTKQIAETFSCDPGTVRKHKQKLGISTEQERIKKLREQTEYICSQYGKKTSTVLSKELSCSTSFISKIWTENHLSGSISTIYYSDEQQFETIDTPEKAYWIGYIAADGCLYDRQGHQSLLSLSVEQTDEELLLNFKEFLHSEKPIKTVKDARRNTYMSSLQITSNKIGDDLKNIGIIPQKTWAIDLNAVLSHIPNKYFSAFLLGYMDGDGSITRVNTSNTISKCRIAIVGPTSSMQVIAKKLTEWDIDAHINELKREKYSNSFSELSLTNSSEKYCFLKLLYTYNIPCLKRKQERANELMRRIKENVTNRAENKEAIKKYQSVVVKWEELLEA